MKFLPSEHIELKAVPQLWSVQDFVRQRLLGSDARIYYFLLVLSLLQLVLQNRYEFFASASVRSMR